MHDWFFISLTATVIYGLINFLYKVAAEYDCSSPQIVNKSATTISILTIILILLTNSEFLNLKYLFIFALINSSFFCIGSISKIKALKNIPTSIAFPITKLNGVFVIILSIILLKERPLLSQWCGIFISFLILAYISFGLKNENENSKTLSSENKIKTIGILLALLAAFSTSVSMFAGKFASTRVTKLNYIFLSYTFVMIYTFMINKTYYKENSQPKNKKVYLFGILIGILNFTGYFLVLKAFASGPLSLIQVIFSNSFIIPIMLSIIIFKEKLDYKKVIIILMSVVSIVLIKLKF